MSAPLVVNTRDGVCWTRRVVTSGGIALYAPESVKTCPDFVMATEAELAEHGIVGSAYALPMPVREEPQPEAALPWAHVMADDDLHLFLDDLVSAALNRWRTEPDGTNVPDRVTLTLVEKACARWRTPGQGNRSDEPERDPVDELMGANLSLWEEEQENARLRLALESARRGRRELRARVAELEAAQESPLAFAEKLDAKSLDNFLIALASATEHEPQDAAIARVHELIASYRKESVASVCRCGEPGVDPYACEADDCSYDFPELNPFGGGPVYGNDAKVSRKCSHCGWHTSVWHVDDGSAEEELHGHIVRAHGSTEGGDAR